MVISKFFVRFREKTDGWKSEDQGASEFVKQIAYAKRRKCFMHEIATENSIGRSLDVDFNISDDEFGFYNKLDKKLLQNKPEKVLRHPNPADESDINSPALV